MLSINIIDYICIELELSVAILLQEYMSGAKSNKR